MIDKIKVYKRKDASEVKNFSLTFQEIIAPKLLLIDTYMAEALTLTKTDPLGKFKKEMEGWWFCEEYVVIIGEVDKIYISIKKELINTDLLHNNSAWFTHIYISFQDHYTNTKDIFCDNYYKYNIYLDKAENIYYAERFIFLLEKIFGKIEYNKHHNFPDKISDFNKEYYYSYIGEDKYLKLLELIG